MVKKIFLIVVASFMVGAALSFGIDAEENETIACEEEYKNMLEELPDEVADLLPEKLFSDKAEDIVDGAREATSFSYIINTALEYLGFELKSAVKLLATLIGILLLAAVLNTVKTSFSSSAV